MWGRFALARNFETVPGGPSLVPTPGAFKPKAKTKSYGIGGRSTWSRDGNGPGVEIPGPDHTGQFGALVDEIKY